MRWQQTTREPTRVMELRGRLHCSPLFFIFADDATASMVLYQAFLRQIRQ
jgi:hypothetical protein